MSFDHALDALDDKQRTLQTKLTQLIYQIASASAEARQLDSELRAVRLEIERLQRSED